MDQGPRYVLRQGLPLSKDLPFQAMLHSDVQGVPGSEIRRLLGHGLIRSDFDAV